MPVTLEKKLPIVLLFVFLMLAVIGYFAYRNTISLKEAVNWQKRTQDVLLKLDETLSAAVDVETGGRGFVITGDESFLEPYKNGRQKVLKNIDELKRLLADNPKQTENLAVLTKHVNDRIETTEKYIEIRRTEGLLGGANEVSKGKALVLIDSIRSTVEQMKTEEFNLLKLREENLQTTFNNNFWMMLLGTLAGTISLALANFAVVMEIKRRRLAETALVEANQGLEKRVEERTEELEKANESLRESASEREKFLLSEQTARHEAEVANRLRDEFMATISHELRTPLNAILGWARILKTGKATEKNLHKAIETIIKNADAQNHLIEDLLDVGRIVSGKLTLEIENVHPEELVAAAIETVKPSAEEKSITLSLETDDAAKDKMVAGDPNRLRQIIWNLLTNAVKFTPENGRVNVNLTAQENFVVVRVADNGVGISEEFLPFVFERFRQDSANIKQNGGLGLGLAIVRHLAEMHGGAVSVESDGEDRGSTFTVKFPIAEAAQEEPEEPEKTEKTEAAAS